MSAPASRPTLRDALEREQPLVMPLAHDALELARWTAIERDFDVHRETS